MFLKLILGVILHIVLLRQIVNLANYEAITQSLISGNSTNIENYNHARKYRSQMSSLVLVAIILFVLMNFYWNTTNMLIVGVLFYVVAYFITLKRAGSISPLLFLVNIATLLGFVMFTINSQGVLVLYLINILNIFMLWQIKFILECRKINANITTWEAEVNSNLKTTQEAPAPQSIFKYAEPMRVTEVDRSGKVTVTEINRNGNVEQSTTYNEQNSSSYSSYDYEEDEEEEVYYEEEDSSYYYEEEEDNYYEEENNYCYSYEEEEDDSYDDYNNYSSYEEDEDTRQQFDQIDFANTDWNTFDVNDIIW